MPRTERGHVLPSAVRVPPRTPAEAPVALVVDADDDAREMYRHALAGDGWSVHQAADGRDALVQVYRLRPHTVLLDARLPYIDGQQLCALLRGDHSIGSLRIVATVSDGSPETVHRFRERGADEVFLKPVSIDVLVSAMRAPADTPASAPAVEAVLAASSRSLAKVRAHDRYVSTKPPQPPPNLRCPHCDAVLQYECSHVGGVSARHPEQWDYYLCSKHGEFQYRHRTRKLRASA
jgi:CheY-like chemotaxis protein